jgi:hypothetical protein
LFYERKISSADKIRVGVIGFGIQGHFDLQTALKVPGVELAGICDLYTGRIQNAKELYGNDLFTTRNYKELLDKPDIDAGDHRHHRLLACAHHKRRAGKRESCLLRKANDL